MAGPLSLLVMKQSFFKRADKFYQIVDELFHVFSVVVDGVTGHGDKSLKMCTKYNIFKVMSHLSLYTTHPTLDGDNLEMKLARSNPTRQGTSHLKNPQTQRRKTFHLINHPDSMTEDHPPPRKISSDDTSCRKRRRMASTWTADKPTVRHHLALGILGMNSRFLASDLFCRHAAWSTDELLQCTGIEATHTCFGLVGASRGVVWTAAATRRSAMRSPFAS
jgi:hypothetical protein